MKRIPEIAVKQDIGQDIELFYSFLHNPYHSNKRTMIFKSFPSLEDRLTKTTDEREGLKSLVNEFYDTNKNQIDWIIDESRKLFESESEKALEALGHLMDYEWGHEISYIATPTILPFSPFKGNTFYFSILADLKNKSFDSKHILQVAVHEISHFILFDQVKTLEREKKISEISKETLDYFKEALTAVLMNKEPLKSILGIDEYRGNKELHNLFIEKQNGNTVLFSQFVEECYQESKKEPRTPFTQFLEQIFNILKPFEEDFIEKRSIWNKLASATQEEKEQLRSLYARPVKIGNK